MLRHAIYRGQFLLHIFQQSGYKINEFSRWLFRHWNTILFPVPNLALVLVALIGIAYLEEWLTSTAVTIIMLIFSLFWFGSISDYDISNAKKPLAYTARMIRLAGVFMLLSIWLPLFGTSFAFYTGNLFPDVYFLIFTWVFASLLLPYLLILGALIIYPVESFIQGRFKKMASKKIQSMPDLKVIAITGSYGKTSTKFLIDAVLKERFNVCTTPGSYNTPMGICKVINNDLKASHQILILEMGARYEGNIDELCRIAQPDIAIVTNIGVSHLESFGSVEAIARTKSALIRYLKTDGVAVLNGDDQEVKKMADLRSDIDVVFAGISEQENHIYADNVIYDEHGCSFDICFSGEFGHRYPINQKGKKERVSISLLGEHSVMNSLFAAGIGFISGLRPATVRVGLGKARPVEHRLELKKRNGILLIDDAFNSNPVGARNAISVLYSFRAGNKYVITPGMIELGDRQERENHEFGQWMAKYPPDHVFLVGQSQTKPVFEGLTDGGYPEKKITVVTSLNEANNKLREKLKEGDVVLYENDLPDSYSESPS